MTEAVLGRQQRVADSLECFVAEFAGNPSKTQYLFYPIALVVRLVTAALLALLPASPYLQVGLVLTVEGILCIDYTGLYLAVTRPYTQPHQNFLSFGIELCVVALLVTNVLYSQEAVPPQLLNAATLTIFSVGLIFGLVKCSLSFRRTTPHIYYATLCEDLRTSQVIAIDTTQTHENTVTEYDKPGEVTFRSKARRGILERRNQEHLSSELVFEPKEVNWRQQTRLNDIERIEREREAHPARVRSGSMDVYPGIVEKYLSRIHPELANNP